MSNFLSEANIEAADIQLFQSLGYTYLNADGKQLLDRENLREVVFKNALDRALTKLNPHLPKSCIEDAIEELTQIRSSTTPVIANKEIYELLKHGVEVYFDKEEKQQKDYVRIIDFRKPENNEFLLVQQLSIEYQRLDGITRRPDLLLYINGLPLVYIELKNASENIKKGYDKNLADYQRDIPQLFYYNLFVCISNGIQTRVGSFNADWEHFFPWAKLKDSADDNDQATLIDIEKESEKSGKKISLQYFCEGLCRKDRLIDYLENFVLFHKNKVKIIAKNHQFLGVNSAFESFKYREGKSGKLGIFWHTQGSGKSYSMIFLARKVFRKIGRNFSFLIITDRKDLDDQIFRNFQETETIILNDGEKDHYYRPRSRKKLLGYLNTNRKFVFSLIHKFGLPKGRQMKEVTDRKDWVVIIDEAHRSQYKTFADNLRIALPKAQYLAFTGTPIFRNKLTENWFGPLVSQYDFLQSIEDGATVPLFYKRGVPRVEQVNEALSDEVAEIFEEENLTEEQIERIEREYSTIVEVVKRDDRLNEIAQHIVRHFPYRLDVRDDEGNRKPMKAMVIAIDKFTTVRMFDKVQFYLREELKELNRKVARAKTSEEKHRFRNAVNFIKETEMAVVISEEADEEKKFANEGLDIKTHRKKLDTPDEDGRNLEDYFKDPNHPLRIVFVTAMWLTGFDAPSVSTLYLDKPMKMHTLMQAIARANRVIEGKKNGLVVDYFGVFRNLKEALSVYAETTSDEEGNEEEKFPVKDFDELLALLEEAIQEAKSYCLGKGVDIQKVLDIGEKGFKEISLFEDYADILLENDEMKKQYNLYTNSIISLYDSARPEIYDYLKLKQSKEVFEYLKNVVNRNQDSDKLDRVKQKITDLLDTSVLSTGDLVEDPKVVYRIKDAQQIDLSKLDIGKLKEEFQKRKHQHIAFADLRKFLAIKLQQMLRANKTLTRFVERLERIIEDYNSGSMALEEAYEELANLHNSLTEEEEERISMGMSPQEKEVFDLLKKDKLTKAEEVKVKNAAKGLLEHLYNAQNKILVLDWHKSKPTRERVKSEIQKVLDKELPQSYDRSVFAEKSEMVFQRMYELAEEGRAFAA